ncbi:PleD family two-component system response regulator [Stappia indica]|uniref:hypothetical protein n=1 Tax=Stappia indica TaxID=538381 RepID=UPI001CD5FF4E|nr:hypothetical protein [Stappia indica]MCA1297005.1 hypothetical protein [Stappia indica]
MPAKLGPLPRSGAGVAPSVAIEIDVDAEMPRAGPWLTDGLVGWFEVTTKDALQLAKTHNRFPDAIAHFRGQHRPSTEDSALTELVHLARARGLELPVFVIGGRAGQYDGAVRPAAYADPSLSAPLFGERLGDVIREIGRLSEIRLRRRVFGALPGEWTAESREHSTIALLVLGLSHRFGAVFGVGAGRFEIVGAFTFDMAMQFLEARRFDAVLIDCPPEMAIDYVTRLRFDPRHVNLPVIACARDAADAARLHAAGASDVLAHGLDPAELSERVRIAIRAGARRHLAGALLRRFRHRHLGERGRLPRAAYDRYLAELSRILALQGREPLAVPLTSFHPDPLWRSAANDEAFRPAGGNPLRSAALAASREEDFVATVEGLGDMVVLRDAAAVGRLARRLSSIVSATSFL